MSTLDQKILSATASARRAGRDEGLRAALEAVKGLQSCDDYCSCRYCTTLREAEEAIECLLEEAGKGRGE